MGRNFLVFIGAVGMGIILLMNVIGTAKSNYGNHDYENRGVKIEREYR